MLLAPVALALSSHAAAVEDLRRAPPRAAIYVWHLANPLFGGFSSLEVGPDGSSLVILTDRGYMLQGSLERDADGWISGVRTGFFHKLKGHNGKPLPWSVDSEGMALAGDGQFYVSFEGNTRVVRYPGPGGPGTQLPIDPAFKQMLSNSGLESLAVDDAGRLYTMPEKSAGYGQPFPIYRFSDGHWDQPFSIPRRGPFLVTGADFGPDGHLYVLERALTSIFGFRSRVRRFTVNGDSIGDERTVFESDTGQFDNLEGISAWRDKDGAIRLTMVSDDNFKPFQKTELVEVRLP